MSGNTVACGLLFDTTMKNQDYAFETIDDLAVITGGASAAPSVAQVAKPLARPRPLTGAALDRYNAQMAASWRRTMWEQMGRSAY